MSKWYGSLDNRLMENSLQPVPEIGMGATVTLWSDKHAYTIIEVSNEVIKAEIKTDKGIVVRSYPKWIQVTRDEVKIINGESVLGSPKYEFISDFSGKRETYFFHKLSGNYRKETTKQIFTNGEIREIGTGRTKKDNQIIIVGVRQEYFDPHF